MENEYRHDYILDSSNEKTPPLIMNFDPIYMSKENQIGNQNKDDVFRKSINNAGNVEINSPDDSYLKERTIVRYNNENDTTMADSNDKA